AILPRDLQAIGYPLILCNTYHLYLQPGDEVIRKSGGLHRFIGWPGAILTDSGGYQVISLSRLRRTSDEGVEFRSPRDGARHSITPEKVIQFQLLLGSDLLMPLDDPASYPATEADTRVSLYRTVGWLKRSVEVFKSGPRNPATPAPLLFGIIQGGFEHSSRKEGLERILAFDEHLGGYAIGGLSVGEPKALAFEIIEALVPFIPKNKPRYLMGMGTPDDIERAVTLGMDLFDCVLPTRLARHGAAFTSQGKLNLKHANLKDDFSPVDPACECYTCRNFSRAYLRHLHMANEILFSQLVTLHNLHFYQTRMHRIRTSVQE
ncbi:MAG: tRNA guanosine(34) transglycosylase Tgt, partial [bacterium]